VGFDVPCVFTFQAVVEVDGAGSASPFSVTNAVVLRIE
jgi:hypothetical protein